MMHVKCVEVLKTGNKIFGYALKTENGKVRVLSKNELVVQMSVGTISVSNLVLAPDGKIVESRIASTPTSEVPSYLELNRYVVEGLIRGIRKNISFRTVKSLDRYLLRLTVLGVAYTVSSRGLTGGEVTLVETGTEVMFVAEKPFKVINGVGLFADSTVRGIDLSGIDSTAVTDMSKMFFYCEAKTINLGGLCTHNVKLMDDMFYNCHVRELDLRGLDTAEVVSMKSMFEGCHAQRLDITGFDTSKVVSMSKLFKRTKAQEIICGGLDTSRVKDMSQMFFNCKATSVDISSFITSAKTNTRGMFLNCDAVVQANDTRIIKEMENRRVISY